VIEKIKPPGEKIRPLIEKIRPPVEKIRPLNKITAKYKLKKFLVKTQ
jgi:hypothetical protein